MTPTAETDTGQLYLDAPAETPAGQTQLDGIAAPPVPNPPGFQRDATEAAAREQLDALTAEEHAWYEARGTTPEAVHADETADLDAHQEHEREPCEWCGGEADPRSTCPKGITCPRCDAEPGARCRRPSGHPAAELHAERIAVAEGADTCPDAATIAPESDAEDDPGPQPRPKRTKPEKRSYACGECGRTLKRERWVYSSHTGSRYCLPGEGCGTAAANAARDRRYAKRAAERARKED